MSLTLYSLLPRRVVSSATCLEAGMDILQPGVLVSWDRQGEEPSILVPHSEPAPSWFSVPEAVVQGMQSGEARGEVVAMSKH